VDLAPVPAFPTALTELVLCPKCSVPFFPGSCFCRQCGEARKAVPTHCQHCGAEYASDANYCRVCGSHRHNTPTTIELGYKIPNAKSDPADSSGEAMFELEKKIEIHSAQVHGIAMGKSSEMIATASWDRTAKIFNLRANEIERTWRVPGMVDSKTVQEVGGLYAVAFSKTCDDLVGCTSADQAVYLWSHETGDMRHRFIGHTAEVNDLDFHPTQEIMATASDDCKCIVWDVQEGHVLRRLDKHFKQVYGCTFLGRQNPFLLATGSFDQHFRIFDMRNKSEVISRKEHCDDVIGLDYCSQKQLLATGSDDGTVCIWDARMGWTLCQKINTNEGGRHSEVKRVAFSPSGAWLAAASSSGDVLVYEAESGKRLASLSGHKDCVFGVAWGVDSHTDAKVLVSASHDCTCLQWRALA
jgi:WD40 repeat protein